MTAVGTEEIMVGMAITPLVPAIPQGEMVITTAGRLTATLAGMGITPVAADIRQAEPRRLVIPKVGTAAATLAGREMRPLAADIRQAEPRQVEPPPPAISRAGRGTLLATASRARTNNQAPKPQPDPVNLLPGRGSNNISDPPTKGPSFR